jgi:hypothetical protein
MVESGNNPPRFICDAMLGGLARWLRAAGYDADFEYGIDDRELVQRAQVGGQVLLSSDGQIFERNLLKNGQVRSLYVPQQLSKLQQLHFVVDSLGLPLLPPRCMACGGNLCEVPKHTVTGEAPPLAYRNCDRFWRCQRCEKLLWHGTHGLRIERRLLDIGEHKTVSRPDRSRGSAT